METVSGYILLIATRDRKMKPSLQTKRGSIHKNAKRKSVQFVAFHTTNAEHTHKTHTNFILIIFLIITLLHRSCARTNITFERYSKDYDVFEGNPVTLVCELEADDPVVINHKGVAIVENSVLRGSSSKYTVLQPTLYNAFILKINKVGRSDSGRYFCREGIPIVKELNLKVYYWPRSEPFCSSSHNFSTFFFEDMLNDEFEFSCTVENGNPQTEVLIYRKFGREKGVALNVSVLQENIEGTPRRTLTYSSKLNIFFNNSSFVCEARQKMPPTLNEYNYEKICSYGPMTFLPNFTTLVRPLNVRIKEGESLTLMCSSNVKIADLNWKTNFSEGVSWEVKENESDIRLKLLVLKGFHYDVITVVCESTFHNRKGSAVGKVYVAREKAKNFIPVMVSLLIIMTVAIVVIFVLCKFRSKCPSQAPPGSKNENEGAGEEMMTQEGDEQEKGQEERVRKL